MKIIAHRGYWLDRAEKNTWTAFHRSITQGFGIETDIRDYNGELVVNHDVIESGQQPMLFRDFLEVYKGNSDPDALLAINIKSDGLQHLLEWLLKEYDPLSYFIFDMSIPSLYFGYRQTALRIFSSVNEFMKNPIAFDRCNGIWMDAYEEIWYDESIISGYLQQGKHVCITSPELHLRPHEVLWNMLRSSGLYTHPGISICTDLPVEARAYFDL